MKNIINKTLLIFALLFTSNYAFAGSGHSHNVNDATIKSNAKQHLNQLVFKNKLAKSWKDATFLKMEKQGIVSREWLVSFKNPSIQQSSKQTLYIYLTTYGKIKGANFTGE